MAIKNATLDKFGISAETLEKSKDILETFDLGKTEVGSVIHLQFLDSEPKLIKTTGKFNEDKGKEIEQKALEVYVEKVVLPDNTEVPYGQKFTLWLSSSTLNLGIAHLYDDNKDLKGVKAKIKVTTAFFKNVGAENRCYRVSPVE